MASTYTPNKHLELQGTGDNLDTWGAELNTAVFTILDQVLGTLVSIPLTNLPVTLTTNQLQNMGAVFSGVMTGNVTVTVPAVGGFFFFRNTTTGNFTLTLASAGAGTSEILPQGFGGLFFTDGTNIIKMVNPQGAFNSIAVAATVDIGTAVNGLVLATGAGATITSFGTSARSNQPLFMVKFDGINTIQNASIPNPTGADIITAANDIFIVERTGAATYRVAGAYLANGRALAAAGAINVPVTQCPLSGPKDSSGYPNYIPATSANLNLTATGLTITPLIVTCTNGFGSSGLTNLVDAIATNMTWSGLAASQTNYLGWNLTTDTAFSTILQPIYQRGGTISVTNGQYTYDIIGGQMYVGNGSVATAVNAVFLGEAVTSASAVTSTVSYPYRAEKIVLGSIPSPPSSTLFAINMGVPPAEIELRMRARCTLATGSYVVGSEITFSNRDGSSDTNLPPEQILDRNTAAYSARSGTQTGFYSSGANFGVGNANFTIACYASRRF